MAQVQVKFSYISQAKFKSLASIDAGTLYFIAETGELYRGSKLISAAVEAVSEFPASPAIGRLYFNKSTLEGKIHTGTEWVTVIQVAATALNADNTTQPVSGKAVADYVKTNVTDLDYVNTVAFDESKLALIIDDTKEVPLKGLLKADGVSYNEGTLTLPVANGDAIVLNLPKENFVKSGRYDADTESIVLVLQQPDEDGNEQKVVIPVSKLVDISSVTGSNTLDLSMNPDKVITGAVKVSAIEGNLISAKDDGIYVAPVDLSGKVDKVALNKAGEIIVAKADGNVEVSGVKAGGDTLATVPDAVTLATEGAVKKYADAGVAAAEARTDTKLETKVDKSAISTAIPADNASDEKVASEKAVADVKTAVDGSIASAKTELEGKINALDTKAADTYVAKANISTAIPAVDAAVDTKVVSEKAAATTKAALEAADSALLELANSINDAKVDKANISAAIPAVDLAVDTKVASEKAVATVKADAATALDTAKGELQGNLDSAKAELEAADATLQSNLNAAKAELEQKITNGLAWEIDESITVQ